ncbi:ankyrin repeat domain-containing protein 27-like [Chelonus insularis]|uniref:ankyrin repeat domain-containing protein 27-like n=1 Tax=Chelonus insularis TaxID=460826 RepID=UPI00158D04B9|nr:ankyrin repeat domain-containing protein 27-like [Chelonus insularis]
MELKYDENLSENSFLQTIQNDYIDIFQKVIENNLIICVPCQGSFKDNCIITEEIISHHILIPIDDEKTGSSFKTLAGEQLILKDRLLTSQNKHKICTSRLLFEETFYTDYLSKYIVWCIENSLTYDLLNQNNKNDVVTVSTLADCVNILWTDIQDSNFFRDLDTSIESFEHIHKNLEKETLNIQRRLVEKLYQECFYKILSCKKIQKKTSLNPYYLYLIKLAVESYILYGLRNLLPAAISTNTSQKDAELNKIIKNLDELELKDLDIHYDIQTVITRGKMELSRLDSYMTVLGKVECLKRSIRYISQSLGTISSDDLLPILIFIVIKTGLPNWTAQLVFMKQFRFSADIVNKADEIDFLITSLEAAVEHIRSGVLMKKYFKISSDRSLEETQEKISNKKLNELFIAIEKDDLEEIEKIFSQKQQKLISESKLCHPLCRCENCEWSFTEIELTQSSWPTVNSKDNRGRTALHIASIYGHVMIVDFLLANHANPNEPDIDGVTPLHCATSRGHQNTVLLLLQANADANLVDNRGNSPLHLAADHGHETCIKAILYFSEQMGITLNINFANVIGNTPLYYASKWGYTTIVDILLEYGANSKIANRHGQTPLIVAHNSKIFQKLEQQHSYIIENALKISHTPSVNCKLIKCIKNQNQSPPQIINKTDKLLAAIREGDIRLACYYLGLEGPCAKSNIDNNSTLCHPLCVCEKCAPSAEEICDEHYPTTMLGINVSNTRGETALHVACANGLVDLVEILLDAGANVNVCTNNENRTPLHFACSNSRIKVVKLLLNCCTININVKDFVGNTPLHLAAKNGDSHVVELLLRHGADVNSRNFKGSTALDQIQENLSDNGFTPFIYTNVIKILKVHIAMNKNSHLERF